MASLGFSPQIVKMGMAGDVDESVWIPLVSDITADAKRQLDSEGIADENHPRMKAYKVLLSVAEGVKRDSPF